MNNSNKQIAVIGERDIVKVFQAIGYDCFYETERTAMIDRCEQLTKDGYKIILILEKAATMIADYLDQHTNVAYPIIMPIPDTTTASQSGMQRLNQNMEKALGIKVGGN